MSTYPGTAAAKLNKIASLLDNDGFNGKSVYEVSPYHGEFTYQACQRWPNVKRYVVTEGRSQNLEIIQDRMKDLAIPFSSHLRNHEEEWDLEGEQFDIAIHFGLLYHLNNWEMDLKRVFRHVKPGGIMFMETVVIDASGVVVQKIDEPQHDDCGLDKFGTYLTAEAIETLDMGPCSMVRYDDPAINFARYKYDWKVLGSGHTDESYYRRFWKMTKT